MYKYSNQIIEIILLIIIFINFKISKFIIWTSNGIQYILDSIYSIPFYKIIVPTVDTIRYDYIVSSLLSNGFPVLVVGPVGTGKTSTIHSVLELLDDTKYAVLLVNMSAQTTSGNVQVRLWTYIEWIIVLNIEWTFYIDSLGSGCNRKQTGETKERSLCSHGW